MKFDENIDYFLYVLKNKDQLNKPYVFENKKYKSQFIYFCSISNQQFFTKEFLLLCLYSGAETNSSGEDGLSGFWYICHINSSWHNPCILEEFLKQRADLNSIDPVSKQTAFFGICSRYRGGYFDRVLETCLKYKGDLNIENIYGDTPFMYVCLKQKINTDSLRKCLRKKVNLNHKNNAGLTPFTALCYATSLNFIESGMLDICMEKKADLMIKTDDKVFPAYSLSKLSFGTRFEDVIVKLFIKNNVDFTMKYNLNEDLFYLSCCKGKKRNTMKIYYNGGKVCPETEKIEDKPDYLKRIIKFDKLKEKKILKNKYLRKKEKHMFFYFGIIFGKEMRYINF
jgi:hypothetical protein